MIRFKPDQLGANSTPICTYLRSCIHGYVCRTFRSREQLGTRSARLRQERQPVLPQHKQWQHLLHAGTVEPLYKGQVGGGSFVPYTVEPLYKGQVGGGSFVPYTVEPLYKGQVGGGSFVPYTVEPHYKGQVGGGSFVPYTVEPLYYKGLGDRSFRELSSSQRYVYIGKWGRPTTLSFIKRRSVLYHEGSTVQHPFPCNMHNHNMAVTLAYRWSYVYIFRQL